MKQQSFGIIPAKKNEDGIWEFLLIRHHAGHWGFPKGHAEPGEDSLQTATRELFEETGLEISRLLTASPMSETYFFTLHGKKVKKSVGYFLAEVQGEVVLQAEEVNDSKWVAATEAEGWITFEEAKHLCRQALLLLK
jgi:bis(5'-nucleosidyl)-tetraphosphatase